MPILLVVNDPDEWEFDIPGVDIVAARNYLIDPVYSHMRGAKVFNLCRNHRYQSTGYYVTLLAEARGHRPQPNIAAIQHFRSAPLARELSEDLAELIQKDLSRIQSNHFDISIYFGKNLAKRYARLSLKLFNLHPAPLLRASFRRDDGHWELEKVMPIPAIEIPQSHKFFIKQAAQEYFEKRRWLAPRQKRARYDLAILHYPKEEDAPSDQRALKKFIRAAEDLGIAAELVTKNDYGRLGEYDALFIRETTSVNHHTYRFARRAESYGMVVIDDSQSIMRCGNKVFLAEALERHGIPHPRTLVLHRDNTEQHAGTLTFPCVLKQPDSAFSQGVIKVNDLDEFEEQTDRLLSRSDLVIAQEFTPSEFDWRIGVIDGKPLFACRYFMAAKHWQIVKRENGEKDYGKVQTLPVEQAPEAIVKAALRAADLMGHGFYGVDVKELGGKPLVIEVNDNPNINSGFEDKVLGQELYERIMRVFLERIEKLKGKNGPL